MEFHFNKFALPSISTQSNRAKRGGRKNLLYLNLIKSFMKMWKDWPWKDVSEEISVGKYPYLNVKLLFPFLAVVIPSLGDKILIKKTRRFGFTCAFIGIWNWKNMLEIGEFFVVGGQKEASEMMLLMRMGQQFFVSALNIKIMLFVWWAWINFRVAQVLVDAAKFSIWFQVEMRLVLWEE